MARLAGGSKNITGNINMEEWARQADRYDRIYNDGLWNKALQISAIMKLDHPFCAVRVREILRWAAGSQYQSLKQRLQALPRGRQCPVCGRTMESTWTYCKYCGTKL